MTILQTVVRQIGSRVARCWWRSAVNSGPGAVPREHNQASRAESGQVEGLRDGELTARKDLFSALVASLVVYDRDDIRPTFRLYGLDQAHL